jgi:hypothetical protein
MRYLFTVFIAASLVLGACSASTPVSDAVRARAAVGSVVTLAEVTGFQWDTVHIFGPYHLQERVCGALGASWSNCTKHVPTQGLPEGVFLTVFSLQGRVVHHELHPRSNGEYCPDSCALLLQKQQAVFKVMAIAGAGASTTRFRLVRSAA